MSSFVTGLAVGLVVGGLSAVLVLKKPWQSDQKAAAQIEIDAGVEADTASKGKRGKKRRGGKGRQGEVALQEIDERILLTPADRKMAWRGPTIVMPEQKLDFAEGGGGRSLDQSEIGEGVSRGQNAMVSCIAEARGQAELAANITLKMLVNGQGGVTKLRVQAPSYLLKHGLYECAKRATGKMRFAGTGGHTVVTVPFDLSF